MFSWSSLCWLRQSSYLWGDIPNQTATRNGINHLVTVLALPSSSYVVSSIRTLILALTLKSPVPSAIHFSRLRKSCFRLWHWYANGWCNITPIQRLVMAWWLAHHWQVTRCCWLTSSRHGLGWPPKLTVRTAIWSPSKSALNALQTSGCSWIALPSISTGSNACKPKRWRVRARFSSTGCSRITLASISHTGSSRSTIFLAALIVVAMPFCPKFGISKWFEQLAPFFRQATLV